MSSMLVESAPPEGWWPFPEPHLLNVSSLLFLLVMYGYALFQASDLISEGSELLLLVPRFAPVVGSIVLPILGAVPDGMMVLVSGLGANAQQQVSAGVGALAGSTVMLLTLPWFLSVLGGRVSIVNGVLQYKAKGGEKLQNGSVSLFNTGVGFNKEIGENAKLMLVTLSGYLVVQIPALFWDTLDKQGMSAKDIQTEQDGERTKENVFALVALIWCAIEFVAYLYLMMNSGDCEAAVDDAIADANVQAMRAGKLTLRGAMANFRDRNWAHITKKSDLDQVLLNKNSLDEVRRMCKVLAPFFAQYDVNGDNTIDFDEFRMIFRDVNENVSKEAQEQMFRAADTDQSGSISFEEFVACFMSFALDDKKMEAPEKKARKLPKYHEPDLEGGDDDEDDDDEDGDDEEEDIPDDLADLDPEEQQKRIKMRSATKMALGTFLVLAFSDPTVDLFSELGERTGVPVFYISFVLAPIASNASELVASFNLARKRTIKSMTASLSTLLGAGIMNNTFCLGIFMALIYFKQLAWEFTAETTSIVVIQLLIGLSVCFREQQRLFDAFLILSYYPLALAIVYVLEEKMHID
eukprot:TRINITY_DN15002_c0_g2_i1.p1 TRINITY_DN15002_c0_g2~~TRINITY_DN15002_c0_g2_i1.p1  ORF type:complete len:603 (+),score=130.31 TRINITY_DN15002_c0_g2_i1:73-1809(+)